jgi:3'(2'), 5'-bisphosphate nucleotidase
VSAPAATAEELDAMVRVARAAAARVMEIRRGGDLGLEDKAPGDPVTQADKQANALIVGELAAAFPGHGIVAEETAPASGELARLVARERVFFVDPVDGTREFSQGLPEFAVMIGLAVDGVAAAGVLVLPAEGTLLAGRVGAEAFLERDAAPGVRALLRPSAVADPAAARVVVSRSHPSPELARILEELGGPTEIPCGSVGVKVARVAVGDADLYVHPGRGAKLWDACGPDAVIRAAGGTFTDVLGAAIDYARPELALTRGMTATNGPLLESTLAAARAVVGDRWS